MRSIFEISTRAMLSAQKSSEVTSNNIANAQTAGYTRQRALLTEEVQRLATGVFGRGVSVSQVERLRNELIDQQIIRKEHEIGDLSEKANIYRLMETSLIPSSDSGLDQMISDFFGAYADVSSNPQDANLRTILVSKSEMMASTFRELDKDMESFGNLALDQAQIKLNRLNDLLSDIGSLNLEIARTHSTDSTNNNVLDIQMEKLKELASITEFDAIKLDDGTLEIRIGGISVVSGQEVSTMSPEVDATNQKFRIRLPGGKTIEPGPGELSANIHMYEKGIPEARNQLDLLATSLMDEINQIHSDGYGLDDGTQRLFFDPASTSALNMRVNDAIVQNPNHIAASSVAGEPGNNDRAIDVLNLQSERFIEGHTISTKAVEFMGLAGLKLNEIEQKIESGKASREFLINRQEQLSGVSIDEELSNLIRFQNSFQASAKVLDTGRQMFDTLMSIA